MKGKKDKMFIISLLKTPPSNPAVLELDALDAHTRGCFDITSAQEWQIVIFQIQSSYTFLDNFGDCNFQKSYCKTSRFI